MLILTLVFQINLSTQFQYFYVTIGCLCNADGSESQNCDENGKCSCKPNVVGDKCTDCATGFVTFPNCDTCDSEFFGYPDCKGKFWVKLGHWLKKIILST